MNYFFENALEDVCMSCGFKEDCENPYELNDNCPLFGELQKVKAHCDDLLITTNELASQARKFTPPEPLDYGAYEADMLYKQQFEQPA